MIRNGSLKAWEHLLRAAPAAGRSDAYRYDLVNVTRQVLGNYSLVLQARAADAWASKTQRNSDPCPWKCWS